MQISTTTLYATLLSILGASKTAFANPNEDAFGITNYGFQCQGRVYPKYTIYAASNRYCRITNANKYWDVNSYNYEGYRSKNDYGLSAGYGLFGDSDFILPILEDGTLYPFDVKPEQRVVETLLGEMVILNPGPDRLVIDGNCNIKGIFVDLHHTIDTNEAGAIPCRALKLKDEYLSALARSQRSPSRSREQSPDRASQRSREQSPDRASQRSHRQSPDRASQRSPE